MERHLIEEKISQVKSELNNKNIIIWGASKFGELVAGILKSMQIDFSVVDSRFKCTDSFNIIFSPEYLEGKHKTHFILVAMNHLYKEVEDQLNAYGYVFRINYFFLGDSPRIISSIADYKDSHENMIIGKPKHINSKIIFKGRNNKITFEENVSLSNTTIIFQADDGCCYIGERSKYKGQIFIGLGCKVKIGSNLTVTNNCLISTAEFTDAIIGNDCMFATNNQIRCDDGHPIFSIQSGERVNNSRSILVGHHVWLAHSAVLLSGAKIGDGSVIGHSSVVKRMIPNNCVAVGVPAKVVKRNIVWDSTHLSSKTPYNFPNGEYIQDRKYWNETEDLT